MTYSKLAILITVLLLATAAPSQNLNFTYNGFRPLNPNPNPNPNPILDGIASYTSNGLLKLTNDTKQKSGHAFFPSPINFKNSQNGTVLSFSTTFVFAIASEYVGLSGNGIAFVVAPTRGLPEARQSQYLGLFNESNNGDVTNRVVAVELDTIMSSEFRDIDDNHAGIDINGLISENSTSAGYFPINGEFKNLTLSSGEPMQAWVDYNATVKKIDVTLAPMSVKKPPVPLLSLTRDLSPIFNREMFVGFSSATGSVLTSHYILGWSFNLNGPAQELDLANLPKLPRPKKVSLVLAIGLPVICVFVIAGAVSGTVYAIRRRRRFAELVEDWEIDYGPQRYKYKDLYVATKGFREKELLGAGGFGRVYKGTLRATKTEVAVKRVSHDSRQGMREFVAEIVSIGRLRHRNLVTLLGYCRRKGELLLVYDYMPNGSLDKYLFDDPRVTLNWGQRFRVIKGVASGLAYLHGGWEQIVVHRDIKSSNVLLDGELNGRLGDFGLARLYDHGSDPTTTRVVGTLGYLAPEHTRTGKATTSTDVYAFGAFLLEVACGKRPIETAGDLVLVDWVFSWWSRGDVVGSRDLNLGTDYVAEEIELVLKLGLFCSHSEPAARPTMRQVVQYLDGDVPLPELSCLGISAAGLTFAFREGFDGIAMSFPFSMEYSHSSSAPESLLSGGR